MTTNNYEGIPLKNLKIFLEGKCIHLIWNEEDEYLIDLEKLVDQYAKNKDRNKLLDAYAINELKKLVQYLETSLRNRSETFH